MTRQELALDLMDWHGGQGSDLYLVASNMFSWEFEVEDITSSDINYAIMELERTKDQDAIDLSIKLYNWAIKNDYNLFEEEE